MVAQKVTPAEYLEFERQADWKHEYIDGCIVAMSGGSPDHSLIAMNAGTALNNRLQDRPCRVFNSDLRVGNAVTGRYMYPDVSVVCGQPELQDDEKDILLNPTLFVEVLSPSTEAYDRGGKFADYQRIPSLQEYVLIAQDRPSVDHFLRQGEQWLLTPVRGLDASVTLPTLGCTSPLREIYRLVEFSPEPAS